MYAVWIDLNGDSFEDAGELVMEQSNHLKQPPFQDHSHLRAKPRMVLTRMRVSMKIQWNTFLARLFHNGEVEDYLQILLRVVMMR
jgi:uncharacterized membrane-anchored protein